MKIITASNLYPWPGNTVRGLYNYELFRAMREECEVLRNLCLVASANMIGDRVVREWKAPNDDEGNTLYVPYRHVPVLGRSSEHKRCESALSREGVVPDGAEHMLGTWLYPDGVAVADVARARDLPYSLMAHGSDVMVHMANPARLKKILAACEGATAVFAKSNDLKGHLVDLGVDAARVRVAANGVDGDRFQFGSQEKARKAVGQDTSGKIILFVGNLVPVKGLSDLIVALSMICRSDKDVKLVMVGEGPEKKRLAKYAAMKKVAGNVRFTGAVEPDDVAHWINAADCLCLPGLSEGMPNAAIEAVSSGLPVVASDVGGTREVLGEDSDCRLVDRDESGFAKRLATGVDEVLTADIDRAKLADRFAGRFSWRAQAKTIIDAIGERT